MNNILKFPPNKYAVSSQAHILNVVTGKGSHRPNLYWSRNYFLRLEFLDVNLRGSAAAQKGSSKNWHFPFLTKISVYESLWSNSHWFVKDT